MLRLTGERPHRERRRGKVDHADDKSDRWHKPYNDQSRQCRHYPQPHRD